MPSSPSDSGRRFVRAAAVNSTGAVASVNLESALRRHELMDALQDLQGKNGYLFSALMVTDIIEGGTQLLCVGDCSYVHQAFDSQAQNGVIDLPGVMSRKKQVAPLLLSVL